MSQSHDQAHKVIADLKDRLTNYPSDTPAGAFALTGALRRYYNAIWDHLAQHHGVVAPRPGPETLGEIEAVHDRLSHV